MHSSMSAHLTGPAQKSPSKLRCLQSTFHHYGGEVSQCGPPTSNQIRRGCRPGREGKRRAILTEPTGASACPPFCRQGWSPASSLLPYRFEKKKAGPTVHVQVPKYPYYGTTRTRSHTKGPIPSTRTVTSLGGQLLQLPTWTAGEVRPMRPCRHLRPFITRACRVSVCVASYFSALHLAASWLLLAMT